ncbi:sulfatase [Lutibacter sp. HS1-25]|uniref:sulfatase family protein n=1 Tax=Lutibacter sp. HS1-25 TaxID=2485000 RepID=UPI00101198C8|nr:sulfatase [Lutibacter sp. HS1-25]RXP44534.1 sulfatase [Lutibacter sp. HS1-25]
MIYVKNILFIISLVLVVNTSNSQNHINSIKPNIVWIVCEDISPTLSMYGDFTAKTPNLDKLAGESIVYDNAFAPVGVCAPTRSSIITGMYPISIGTMNMRTGKDIQSWGVRKYENKIQITDIEGDTIRQYSAVVPSNVKCFTEYLRADGYYCTNNQKTDYQFAAPITAWDENNSKAHWRNTPKGMPFFSVFNFGSTHESKIWLQKKPLTVNPETVPVPPYFQDTEIARNDIARHYSNVEIMDAEVGQLIQQLKEDGLYENTIIFFYSDHGGPLPRQKRAILDSGLKVPFMVKNIGSSDIGRTDRLISFTDLAPTVLSLAGIQPPNYMDGSAFLGKYIAKPRDYVFGSSDRFDESSDRIRSVRNKQYLYLKNYFPKKTKYKDISYRKNIPMMNELLDLKEQNKLNEIQLDWFNTKTTEELYDCEKDPYNLINLAENPDYHKVLIDLRNVNDEHFKNFPDLGMIPEAQLINRMWPNFEQPQTDIVTLLQEEETIYLSTTTEGASIAYILSDNPNLELDYNSHWKLYSTPIKAEKNMYIYTIAERIGFKESDIVMHQIK